MVREVVRGDELAALYDASQPNYERTQAPSGALRFLVKLAFFAEHELDDALDALASSEPVEVTAGGRRVMTIVENLKKASALTKLKDEISFRSV
ncbi:MAG TPA: hypothetical protein VF331_13855 [Polyangiales bacterium]